MTTAWSFFKIYLFLLQTFRVYSIIYIIIYIQFPVSYFLFCLIVFLRYSHWQVTHKKLQVVLLVLYSCTSSHILTLFLKLLLSFYGSGWAIKSVCYHSVQSMGRFTHRNSFTGARFLLSTPLILKGSVSRDFQLPSF